MKKIGAVFALAALLIVFAFMEDLTGNPHAKSDPTAKISAMEKDSYNGYGLPEEQELSHMLLTEYEDVVCYADRLFRRFSYEEDNFENLKQLLDGLRRNGAAGKNLYVAPLPPRVLTETGYESDMQRYQSYLTRLSEHLWGRAAVVDVYPALAEHKGEYIFYRTEDAWTARGAYYGSVVLCEALGISPIPLSEYEEHMYQSLAGTFRSEISRRYEAENGSADGIAGSIAGITTDAQYFFLLPGAKNTEEVTDKTRLNQAAPTVSQSRTGLSTFVGGATYWYALLHGDALGEETKEETLLLLCDKGGKLLAPFLANYYQNVYVVNVSENSEFSDDILGILGEYPISDIVWAQDAADLGKLSESAAVRGLIE